MSGAIRAASGPPMSGSMRVGRAISALMLAGAALFAPALPAAAERPARVVSMNLCTDQLAMLLADEGQLVSVSFLAADPRNSAMAGAARGYQLNHGRAEEIFLMRPDLVIASRFTDSATLDMLRRLGIPVALFEPATTLPDISDRLIQMGEVLGQPGRAARAAAQYEARLRSLQAEVEQRPRAALYFANGYTLGDKTLAGQILLAAGFENVASAAGYAHGGTMPLEVLALSAPDALLTGNPYPGGSRSEDILDHPVVRALREGRLGASVADRDWICGTPYVLEAVERLMRLRQAGPEMRQ